MRQREENKFITSKEVYASPSITKIRISADILTESPTHNDDNMGEWDTVM